MSREKEYALLVKISEIMNSRGLVLGKIFLQQLVYIFQEFYSIVLSYKFELLTYGPYSVELIDDLDYLFSKDTLKVEYCYGPEYYGSKILPGNRYREAYLNCENFLQENERRISILIDLLGKHTARQLELMGAIIYFKKNHFAYDFLIVENIQMIKPYFKEVEVIEAIKELKEISYRVQKYVL